MGAHRAGGHTREPLGAIPVVANPGLAAMSKHTEQNRQSIVGGLLSALQGIAGQYGYALA